MFGAVSFGALRGCFEAVSWMRYSRYPFDRYERYPLMRYSRYPFKRYERYPGCATITITEPISQINQNAHHLADIARRYSLETIPGWIPDSKTGLYFPPEKPGNNLDDKDADESGEDGLDK